MWDLCAEAAGDGVRLEGFKREETGFHIPRVYSLQKTWGRSVWHSPQSNSREQSKHHPLNKSPGKFWEAWKRKPDRSDYTVGPNQRPQPPAGSKPGVTQTQV